MKLHYGLSGPATLRQQTGIQVALRSVNALPREIGACVGAEPRRRWRSKVRNVLRAGERVLRRHEAHQISRIANEEGVAVHIKDAIGVRVKVRFDVETAERRRRHMGLVPCFASEIDLIIDVCVLAE
jgi:hypothetical protein